VILKRRKHGYKVRQNGQSHIKEVGGGRLRILRRMLIQARVVWLVWLFHAQEEKKKSPGCHGSTYNGLETLSCAGNNAKLKKSRPCLQKFL